MNVLMLSWEYPPQVVGGLARHVAELSEHLARQGHQVTVATAGDGRLPRDEIVRGVRVLRTGGRDAAPRPLDFISSIMQLNLDLVEEALEAGVTTEVQIVHAHDWLVAYAAKLLKHSLRRPLVATIHATEHGRNRGLHDDLQRYIANVEWWLTYEAWKVIACSQFMKSELRGVFQVPADKIQVIPNGVVPERCRDRLPVDLPGFRHRYAAPDEQIVFFMGRLVPEKGIGILLEAIPQVLTYFPKTKFVISGTGPQEAELKARARDLGVYDRIYFTGFIDDVMRNGLLSVADVAVFPSTYEPFGIVVLEAMAAGVPVVVGDTGGLGEIVEHGRNGLKAYPGNPHVLAHQVMTMLGSHELRERLSAMALQDVETIYSWDRIAQAVTQVYGDVGDEYVQSDWGREALEREAWNRGLLDEVFASQQPALVGLTPYATRSRYPASAPRTSALPSRYALTSSSPSGGAKVPRAADADVAADVAAVADVANVPDSPERLEAAM